MQWVLKSGDAVRRSPQASAASALATSMYTFLNISTAAEPGKVNQSCILHRRPAKDTHKGVLGAARAATRRDRRQWLT